jgi:hypothetical protein
MDAKPIEQLAIAESERMRAIDAQLLDDLQPQRYIGELDAVGQFAGYHTTTAGLRSLSDIVLRRAGQAGLECYHRLILLRLIADFGVRAAPHRYPEGVRQRFDEHFKRIVREMAQPRDGFYVLENDSFCKDLAVCRQHMIPCGVQLVEKSSGLPRGRAMRRGVAEQAEMVWMVFRLGGFRPMLQIHTDRRQLREFNLEGWSRFYRVAAELLKWNPRLKGMFGGPTWWWDPAVSEICPHLAYLREIPKAAGARFFQEGESDENTATAVANSPERYRLWKEGRYHPRAYLMVWPREDLLKMFS